MLENGNDDKLFGRLRRLVESAKTAHLRDRRSILSLEADIRMLRAELNGRCAALTEQMNHAGRRATALNAYARTVSLARAPSPAPSKTPTE